MNLYKLEFIEACDSILDSVWSRKTAGYRWRYASHGMTNTVKTDIIKKTDHDRSAEVSSSIKRSPISILSCDSTGHVIVNYDSLNEN